MGALEGSPGVMGVEAEGKTSRREDEFESSARSVRFGKLLSNLCRILYARQHGTNFAALSEGIDSKFQQPLRLLFGLPCLQALHDGVRDPLRSTTSTLGQSVRQCFDISGVMPHPPGLSTAAQYALIIDPWGSRSIDRLCRMLVDTVRYGASRKSYRSAPGRTRVRPEVRPHFGSCTRMVDSCHGEKAEQVG